MAHAPRRQQLAYLNIKGYVSAVITEDSDIIAFGARVVFFKMDKEGNGGQPRTISSTTLRRELTQMDKEGNATAIQPLAPKP